MDINNKIRIVHLFNKEGSESGTNLVLISFAMGVLQASLIAVINSASGTADYGSLNFRNFALFIIIILLFILCFKHLQTKSFIIGEKIAHKIRCRLSNKLRKCSFQELEKINPSDIFMVFTNDTNIIAQSFPILFMIIQGFVVVIFSLIYIAILSRPAFFVSLCSISIGMVFYLKQAKDIDVALQYSTKFQGKVFDMISDIIHGFKELKINQNKNDKLYKDLVSNSEKVKDIKVNAILPIVRVTLFANIFFYMLIAIVVFVLPNLISEFSDNLPKLTAALLFIVPPLTNVGGSIPVFANSNNAIDKVYSLEKKLDKIQE